MFGWDEDDGEDEEDERLPLEAEFDAEGTGVEDTTVPFAASPKSTV